jgi:hypothetical protein
MTKIYKIEDDDVFTGTANVFTGTLEQFRREQFFPGPCEHSDIVEWCDDQDYQFTVSNAPEDNTHNLKIAGYANKTAMHPLGSYIGFEPGPTVFAQPLVYLGDAQEVIDALQAEIDLLRGELGV